MEKTVPKSFLKAYFDRQYDKCRENVIAENSSYPVILALLIPTLFLFEILIVLPGLSKELSLWCALNIASGFFIFTNIVGNLYYVIKTDTTIRGRQLEPKEDDTDWSTCEFCERVRPPFCRHCRLCDVCVLCRDHHCIFFNCCIGYFNFRYYCMFVLYAMLGMLQSLYLNIKMISHIMPWNSGLAILKFIVPLGNLILNFNSIENVYILVIMINVAVGMLAGYLFYNHMRMCIPNLYIKAPQCNTLQCSKLKIILSEAFGARWYLVWISPLITSSLIGDGTKKHPLISGKHIIRADCIKSNDIDVSTMVQ